MNKETYSKAIKSPLDRICALLALLLLFPLIALIYAFVYYKLGSPALFRQRRPGTLGRNFTLLKFRTMSDLRDDAGNFLPDGVRLTGFGRFLRSTSLDELPSLVNILKGDMSFVGPRPLLPQYLDLYNERQQHRHDVKPGLTGWAQVNGRNLVSWQDRFEMDVQYTENLSLGLDLKILWRTFFAVVKREGISGNDAPTMLPFNGN